jgi:hypothetical protein
MVLTPGLVNKKVFTWLINIVMVARETVGATVRIGKEYGDPD